jgi:hypothetical protein
MLRWIDDYLFITSNKEKAFSFLDSMSEGKYPERTLQSLISHSDTGHPDYGCFISTEKTLTSFWCDKHQPNVVAAAAQGCKMFPPPSSTFANGSCIKNFHGAVS